MALGECVRCRQTLPAAPAGTKGNTLVITRGGARCNNQTRSRLIAGGTRRATTYTYNSDNTINSVTDARGASASYVYNNNRHLVSGINYSAPSGVTATPNVTFGYDAAGNRTSMNDGLGSASYSYNQMSQMTSETRTFNGVGTYSLSYGYNLAGELTSISDPWSKTVNYSMDSDGRLNSVTGSCFGSVSA